MAVAVLLVDTGPLVAALDRSESHHDWAAAPLLTFDFDFRIYRASGQRAMTLLTPEP